MTSQVGVPEIKDGQYILQNHVPKNFLTSKINTYIWAIKSTCYDNKVNFDNRGESYKFC